MCSHNYYHWLGFIPNTPCLILLSFTQEENTRDNFVKASSAAKTSVYGSTEDSFARHRYLYELCRLIYDMEMCASSLQYQL